VPVTLLEQAEVEGCKEMKIAAIYCRVSGDKQEKEGTSLETQLEGSLNYCRDKSYDVRYRFSGVESGLILDRPNLNRLRELIRAHDIDVVVVYCLDRFSRDPTHGVILTQELEKHKVTLEAVTETVDSSELGKLISYIRGFASKLEAEKIKERTSRGRKAKAIQGNVPHGGYTFLYGYDYVRKAEVNGGKRVINEVEAGWVIKIFGWLVENGMSTHQITYKLRELRAPTKHNRMWCPAAVRNIIRNPAYTGRTYAYTTAGHKQFSRNPEEWIELSDDITPAIIPTELFEAAQRQLTTNKIKSPRNTKRQYLLRGHLRCKQCGRAYYGRTSRDRVHGQKITDRRYCCSGKLRMIVPVDRCHNRSWGADKLEAMVWAKLVEYLSQPELIVSELEKQRQDANQVGVFEDELRQVERQLKAIDREHHQLLQWALKGFPESQVEAENRRLNKARETLKAQKTELEAQLKANQDAVINVPKMESFIERIQDQIINLDFEGKRQVLDMLGITVWLDGETVEVTGTIDPEVAIVTTQS